METPYDDVRLALVADLEARTGAPSRSAGRARRPRSRAAPAALGVGPPERPPGEPGQAVVVRQLLRRIEPRPAELPRLLPLLAVALRSVRGPEWRAGLAAVVRLAERDEVAAGLIRQTFPELQIRRCCSAKARRLDEPDACLSGSQRDRLEAGRPGHLRWPRTSAATAWPSTACSATRSASARPSGRCTTSSSATSATSPRTSRPTRPTSPSSKQREAELRRGATVAGPDGDPEGRRPRSTPTRSAALEKHYRKMRSLYWDARLKYSNYLSRHDPELWRLLVPCDPVITVAPDCLFFECFSADESSYGCLTVDRDAFAGERDVALGTTNVDYSWSLYEHFQKLRSYRETRFLVDPAGFEVRTGQADGYREEKIDLPPSWLKGFMQVQAAMSLPMRRVPISREGLYNVLAFLKRHRAARSPRAVRFELTPGQPVAIVLEPWEQRIVLHSQPVRRVRGRRSIRIWGRDRLRLLARLLPLLDEAEVYLLGTGLPSFWSIRMGEMRLLLGLSGWTANDWTGLDGPRPARPPGRAQRRPARRHRGDLPRQPGADVRRDPPAHRRGARLRGRRPEPARPDGPAHPRPARGRLSLAADHAACRSRSTSIGPENPETAAASELVASGKRPRHPRRPPRRRPPDPRRPGPRPPRLAPARRRRPDAPGQVHLLAPLHRRPPQGPCRHLQALRDGLEPRSDPRSLEAGSRRWSLTLAVVRRGRHDRRPFFVDNARLPGQSDLPTRRAGFRDQHAAAFRRGRVCLRDCFPKSVVLLARHASRAPG